MSDRPISKRLRASALIASTVPASLAVTAMPAATQAATHPAHPVKPSGTRANGPPQATWQDRANNNYLTILDAKTTNGAPAATTGDHNGSQQHWFMYTSGSLSGNDLYGFVNAHSFKCLVSVAPVVGDHIHQEGCANSFPTLWAEISVYNKSGTFQGWLLDAPAEALNNGIVACADTSDVYVHADSGFG